MQKRIARFGLLSFVMILFGSAISISEAQAQEYVFTRSISSAQGVSGSVLSLLQDRRGFMWFGTTNGLLRFDGKDFLTFHHDMDNPKTISSEIVEALHEDRNGNLWIAGKTTVSLYAPATEIFRTIPIQGIRPASGIRDQWDFLIKGKALLIKSRATGLIWRYDSKKVLFRPSSEKSGSSKTSHVILENNEPIVELVDSGGDTWKGAGLLFHKSHFQKSFSPVFSRNEKRGFRRVFSLYQDREQSIWVGTDNGVFHFNQRNQAIQYPTKTSGDKVSCLALVSRQIWTGNLNGEINIYDQQLRHLRKLRISHSHLGKAPAIFNLINNSGQVFAAMSNGQVLAIDPHTYQVYERYKAQNKLTVHHGNSLGDQVWWISKQGEILITAGSKTEVIRLKGYDGLNRITFSKDGFVWISTSGYGLLKINAETKKIVEVYSRRNNADFLSDDVLDLAWQNSNVLAMSTSEGIQLLDIQTSSFTTLTRKNGLSANLVINILFGDNGLLYYTGQYNLGILNLKSKVGFNFGANEGIGDQSYAFAGALKLPDGKMIFNSLEGIYMLDPDKIHNSPPPKPEFTSIKVSNQEVQSSGKEKLTVAYDKNFITLAFRCLTFLQDNNLTYHYRMLGVDTIWKVIGDASAVNFSNLKGGDYKFQVRAKNFQGNTSPLSSISIYIPTPVWKTWWFVTFMCILATTPLLIIYALSLKKRKSIEGVKRAISRDLHDGLGSALSTISILSEVLDKQSKPEPELTQEISKLARNALSNMDDLIWAVKDAETSASDYCARMKAACQELTYRTSFKMNFKQQILENQPIMNVDLKYDMLMVSREIVNNAVRHSSGKEISVSVIISKKKIELEISDDGKGFDQNARYDGNGLSNIRSRCAKYDALLCIDSKKDLGTKIKITIIDHAKHHFMRR